jgi:MFS family permease
MKNGIQNEQIVTYTKRYMYYSVLIMGLINLIDIFSSNAAPLVVSYVVDEFFVSKGVPENIAYAQYGIIMSSLSVFMLFGLVIKYIADRYGRKPALIINIIGISLSALLVLFSQSFLIYALGVLIGAVFLNADMQMLFTSEECPKEKRSQFINTVRIVGLCGAILVLVFRFIFMSGPNPNWRALWLLPLIGGIIVTLISIFTLKESSVYLTMKAQRAVHPELKTDKVSFIKAMKSIRKLKNFRLIMITFVVGTLAVLGAFTDSNYMQPYLSQNFSFNEVNFIYILRFVISIPLSALIGLINDKIGRTTGLYTHLILIPIFLILTILFVHIGNFVITGIFYGIFIYSVWLTPATTGTIISELTPTKYRGTIGVYLLIIGYIVLAASTVIFSVMVIWLEFETLFLIAFIPGCLVAIPIVFKLVPETKATDLTKVE